VIHKRLEAVASRKKPARAATMNWKQVARQKRGNMELTINETQAKELLKQVMIELVKEKRGLFFEIVVEAMEEIGLANAIREGRRNEYVSEEQITAILEGRA
jgi:hypothetical protein